MGYLALDGDRLVVNGGNPSGPADRWLISADPRQPERLFLWNCDGIGDGAHPGWAYPHRLVTPGPGSKQAHAA